MKSTYDIARNLVLTGVFRTVDAHGAVNAYIAEQGMVVDVDGYVDDSDAADITAELKG